MRATSTAVVNAPIDSVWALIADHEGMAGWGPGLKVDLVRNGDGDRNGKGAVRKIRTPLPVLAILEEVVDFDPPYRMAYRAVSGVPLKNYLGEIELTTVAAGTRIDYSISADARIPVLDDLAVKAISRGLLLALTRQARRVS
jgi:uncharacterized protein YndB with AHSA1/START domain